MSAAASRAPVRLVVATRSAHKLRELRELLNLPGCELVSLAELGVDIDEDAVRESSKQSHRWRNPIWRQADGSFAEW